MTLQRSSYGGWGKGDTRACERFLGIIKLL
jgi:hypothetical protein